MNELSKKDYGFLKTAHVLSIIFFSFMIWLLFLELTTIAATANTFSQDSKAFNLHLQMLLYAISGLFLFIGFSFVRKSRRYWSGICLTALCFITALVNILNIANFNFSSLPFALLLVFQLWQLLVRIFWGKQFIPPTVIRINSWVLLAAIVYMNLLEVWAKNSTTLQMNFSGFVADLMVYFIFTIPLMSLIPFFFMLCADSDSVFYQYFIINHPKELFVRYKGRKQNKKSPPIKTELTPVNVLPKKEYKKIKTARTISIIFFYLAIWLPFAFFVNGAAGFASISDLFSILYSVALLLFIISICYIHKKRPQKIAVFALIAGSIGVIFNIITLVEGANLLGQVSSIFLSLMFLQLGYRTYTNKQIFSPKLIKTIGLVYLFVGPIFISIFYIISTKATFAMTDVVLFIVMYLLFLCIFSPIPLFFMATSDIESTFYQNFVLKHPKETIIIYKEYKNIQ